MRKTVIMRVPIEFNLEVKRLQKKHGHGSMSELLRNDGVRIFKNADAMTDIKNKFKGLFIDT